MKLKHLLVSAALVALPFAPVLLPSAHAALTTNLNDVQENSGLGATPLVDTIGSLIQTLLAFLGVIFLILIIYAGLLWMTAAGNEDKVKKAQSILMSSIIGLIVLLSAYAISYFVISNLSLATGTTG